MKRSWFPIFLVGLLLSLLGVLAALQYVWLGQVSDGERERMQRVVQSDTQRFAEDFNREIQNAYFNFQTGADQWRARDWREFNERYQFWREKTAYPELIRDFYFAAPGAEKPLRYDAGKGEFAAAERPAELDKYFRAVDQKAELPAIDEELPALLMTINEAPERFGRILVRTALPDALREKIAEPPGGRPERYGLLIILLDGEIIKNRMLPDLARKYFGENESADYRVSVTGRDGAAVFQTGAAEKGDATARLFNLLADNFIFFANREMMPRTEGARKTMVFSSSTSRIDRQKTPPGAEGRGSTRLEVDIRDPEDNKKTHVRVFEGENQESEGIWTLRVQHAAGSLDQFISNTRRKNLGISFGILSLLGVSVILIFVSSQRAKLHARRQIDFVSSVSHEFRTPLAVIYTAAENLADGVAREAGQVSRYGDLIKGEGRKLSAMIEQILEFAGARSGRQKYDLRETVVSEIIDSALAECRPLIAEKGFTVEREIAENLPPVKADLNAMSRALQNLIFNSLKYSPGEKWLKISAKNGGGTIKIAVEDKGIGIAPKDLKHIFEPFYRAKAVVDEQIHGNGLGLSLVRETVEAHGGRVSAQSEPGKGSVFSLRLLSAGKK